MARWDDHAASQHDPSVNGCLDHGGPSTPAAAALSITEPSMDVVLAGEPTGLTAAATRPRWDS